MNKVPIKWNQLIPLLKAKREYENSAQYQLDYLLNRTINDIKYGTTDEEEIKRIKRQRIERSLNPTYQELPPIKGLEEAIDKLRGKKEHKEKFSTVILRIYRKTQPIGWVLLFITFLLANNH